MIDRNKVETIIDLSFPAYVQGHIENFTARVFQCLR